VRFISMVKTAERRPAESGVDGRDREAGAGTWAVGSIHPRPAAAQRRRRSTTMTEPVRAANKRVDGRCGPDIPKA
jgi:hypothetical protein